MQSLGASFTILSSTESTNNYAMQRAHARLAKHGEAWFAMEQTRGKGQRSKNWQSNPGENIILSLVLEPEFLSPTRSFLLNAAIALGTRDFFGKYTEQDILIKWPNDIFWHDRKTGGILIETVIRSGKWLYAIVGIGLNINQECFANDLKAVSLRIITGKQFDVILLAKELCLFLENRYQQLQNGNPALILKDYQNAMYKINETMQFKNKDTIFQGQIKGITPEGLLIIETDQKKIQKWQWGELQWLLA